MDVSKAFDRVDPYLLVRKLLDFGINKDISANQMDLMFPSK